MVDTNVDVDFKERCAELRGALDDKQRSIVNRTQQIHRLEQSLDEAESELKEIRPKVKDARDYDADRKKLREDFSLKAEKNRESMIAMFEKYAKHGKGCVLGAVKIGTVLGCTCGLTQLAKQFGIGESKMENS